MLLDEDKLPPNIKSTLGSLRYVKQKIEELEAELLKAQRERDRLENELAAYNLFIPPIHRVPSEILTAIFEQYVLNRPRSIRNLLLVSRLWHRIAMDEALLWTHVRLAIDKGDLVLIQNAMAFAKACFDRSKQSLLHITLDFGGFPTRHQYTTEHLRTNGLSNNYYAPLAYDDWVPCTPYEKLFEGCEELTQCVVTSMGRWRSLKITFNRSGGPALFRNIWPLFDNDCPMLTELLTEECDAPSLIQHLKPFSKAPLTVLKIQNSKHFINIAKSKPPLRVLECRLDSIQTFQQIHPFQGLRELTLTCESHYLRSSMELLGTEKLFLPSLERLSLQGRVPSKMLHLLDAPSVRDLIIRTGLSRDFKGLPNVSPIHVTWERRHFFVNKLEKKTIIRLRKMLEKYDRMQTFTVYKCYLKPVIRLIVDIRKESDGLQDLRSVIFFNGKRTPPVKAKENESVVNTPIDVSIGRNPEEILVGLTSKDSEDDHISPERPTSTYNDSGTDSSSEVDD